MTQPHDPQQHGAPTPGGAPHPGPYGQPQGGPPPGGYGPVPPGGMPPGGPPPRQYGVPGQPPPPKKRTGRLVGLIAGGVVLAVLLLVGVGTAAWMLGTSGEDASSAQEGGSDGGDASSQGGAPRVDGVTHYDDPVADHVETGESVEYDVHPPVGGEHYNTWQDCGVYEEPLKTEFAVHAMEHGAVWVTYDADAVGQDGAADLADLYAPGDYVVVSPMDGLPSPVVASAWGSQIHLDGADDPRLQEYLREYVQGPNTPEPGAACSGGWDGTEADFDTEFEADS